MAVKLIWVETGEIIAEQSFSGGPAPSQCPETYSGLSSSISGERIELDEVLDYLEA